MLASDEDKNITTINLDIYIANKNSDESKELCNKVKSLTSFYTILINMLRLQRR